MYKTKLKEVLIPPKEVTLDESLWTFMEKNLSLVFPSDFKEFCMIYGVGQVDHFININVPIFNTNEYLKEVSYLCSNYLRFKQEFPNKYTFPVYPEKDGLFPLGTTDNGDEFWWLTNIDLAKWEIVVYESRSWDFCRYQMGLVEFLYKILTKELVCEIFPCEFPDDNIEFSLFE